MLERQSAPRSRSSSAADRRKRSRGRQASARLGFEACEPRHLLAGCPLGYALPTLVRPHAFDGVSVWVGNYWSSTVTRLRVSDGANLGTFPSGGCPRSLAALQARALLDSGLIVIALGGGGVPVMRHGRRLVGAEAVVDKDLASSLLAVDRKSTRLNSSHRT